jgi:membrane associated rhomboid family serine protease
MFALLDFLLTVLLTLLVSSVLTPTPLSDSGNVRYRTIPVMTILLIVANSLIFMVFQAPDYYQGLSLIQGQPLNSPDFVDGVARLNNYLAQTWTFGYRAIFVREGLGIGAFSAFTSMFMHRDLWHLFFNMIYLWTFGRRVEDACGSWRFLAFYLISGLVAVVGWEIFNTTHTDIPVVGASGAIAGIMGAYLVLFPGAMITCFWVVGVILRVPVVAVLRLAGVKWVQGAPTWRWTIRLPAFLLLLFFLGQEAIASLLPFLQTNQEDLGGVAHSAHVAGFLAALVIFLFVRKDLLTRYFSGRRL